MKWFKNLFSSNADDNPRQPAASQELGDYLFGLCVRQVTSFLDIWKESFQEKTKIDRDDIDQIELLIAFMWSYFDLLQNEKYLDALTKMHGRFRQHMSDVNRDTDEMWRLLQQRYNDYRQRHRSEATIDFTYKKAAQEICKNMHGPNLFLEFQIAVFLQKNIQHIGEAIKKESWRDA